MCSEGESVQVDIMPTKNIDASILTPSQHEQLAKGDGILCVRKTGTVYVRRVSAYNRFVSAKSAEFHAEIIRRGIDKKQHGLAILTLARDTWNGMTASEKAVYSNNVVDLCEEMKMLSINDEEKVHHSRTYVPEKNVWLNAEGCTYYESETSDLALGMIVRGEVYVDFYTPQVLY